MADETSQRPQPGLRGEVVEAAAAGPGGAGDQHAGSGWLTGAGLQAHAWWLGAAGGSPLDAGGTPSAPDGGEPAVEIDEDEDWFAPGEVNQLLGQLRGDRERMEGEPGPGATTLPAAGDDPPVASAVGPTVGQPQHAREQPAAAGVSDGHGDETDGGDAGPLDAHPWADDFLAVGDEPDETDELVPLAGSEQESAPRPQHEPAAVLSPDAPAAEAIAGTESAPPPPGQPGPIPASANTSANKLTAGDDLIPPRQRDLAAASGLPAAGPPPPPPMARPEELSRLAEQLAKATNAKRAVAPAPSSDDAGRGHPVGGSNTSAPFKHLPRKPILGAPTAADAPADAAGDVDTAPAMPGSMTAPVAPDPRPAGAAAVVGNPIAPAAPAAGPPAAESATRHDEATGQPADPARPPAGKPAVVGGDLQPMVSAGRALEPELAPIEAPQPPKARTGPPIRTRRPDADDTPTTPGATAPRSDSAGGGAPPRRGGLGRVAAGLLLLLAPPALVWGWIHHGDRLRPWFDQLGWFDSVATGAPGPIPAPGEGGDSPPPWASTPGVPTADGDQAQPTETGVLPGGGEVDGTAADESEAGSEGGPGPVRSGSPDRTDPVMLGVEPMMAPGSPLNPWPPRLGSSTGEGAVTGLSPADWLEREPGSEPAPDGEGNPEQPASADPGLAPEESGGSPIPRATPVDPSDLPVRRAVPAERP